MTAAPAIHDHLLDYNGRLQPRPLGDIRTVVIHCTELPDLELARQYGEQIHHAGSRTGNSGHFYIDRDGRIERYVTLDRIAHHVAGHNADSIGIELVNRGRYPRWLDSRQQDLTEPYTEDQIESLVELLRWLETELPALACIAGHEDLDTRRVPAEDDPARTVLRKVDPGPLFPWQRVLEATGLKRLQPKVPGA